MTGARDDAATSPLAGFPAGGRAAGSAELGARAGCLRGPVSRARWARWALSPEHVMPERASCLPQGARPHPLGGWKAPVTGGSALGVARRPQRERLAHKCAAVSGSADPLSAAESPSPVTARSSPTLTPVRASQFWRWYPACASGRLVDVQDNVEHPAMCSQVTDTSRKARARWWEGAGRPDDRRARGMPWMTC
jgi:hypothetical protein